MVCPLYPFEVWGAGTLMTGCVCIAFSSFCTAFLWLAWGYYWTPIVTLGVICRRHSWILSLVFLRIYVPSILILFPLVTLGLCPSVCVMYST